MLSCGSNDVREDGRRGHLALFIGLQLLADPFDRSDLNAFGCQMVL